MNNLLDNLPNKYKFINNKLQNIIINTINNMFPKLNQYDINILIKLSSSIIDIISYKYNFDETNNDYYLQWEQNNYRDIKGVVLLLLPYINDNNNSYLLSILTDLNHLLYAYSDNYINNNILSLKRNDILHTYFKFGNMAIGLLDKKNEKLLNLYNNNDKLIYDIIHQNYIGILNTLEIMNGKYYINWINIIPYNLDNYKSSLLYKNTQTKIKNINYNKTIIFNNVYYNGIWLGDIYNIIRNNFYQNIIPIKWLIFINKSETRNYYYIQELNKILDLDNILNIKYFSYNNLSENEKNEFQNKISNIIYNYIIYEKDVIKYCLIYFINNNYDISKDNYKYINIFKFKNIDTDNYKDDFFIDDIKKINDITEKQIIECLKYINQNYIKEFWDFLKNQLEIFRKCSFGKYLIINNKIVDNYKYISLSDNIEYNINFKNIYNISKSLSHNNYTDWVLLNDNYLSLLDDDKINFFDKLNNNKEYNKWINLKNNFKLEYINNDDEDVDDSDNDDKYIKNYDIFIKTILNEFNKIIIELIFDDLIVNGILNKFIPNLYITNKNNNINKKSIYDMFNKNKSEWLKSYYYLTNDTFENIPLITINKDTKLHYFDVIALYQSWILYYAMDWISQINFFKHYIYHQILYITGATGQGKSTQVPKLLLYASKIINYKYDSKIIATAPRIPPVIENAERIAFELGFPIYEPYNNKLIINNYYIQYKHQYESHINNNFLYSFIKIVTDGTLLEELSNNIIMLNNYNNIYYDKTKYDIIIIDEAHEHNTNMDIILTLARQTCYLNNKIKLIIVSATMDEDEPLYRIFYKNINDKLMYPIKNIFIKHPILNNNYEINPILMDRRYHISPPGETTQYIVNEYYLPNKINEDDNILASRNAQLKSYEIILDICNKTIYGDILLFLNGYSEIIEALDYLNNKLPLGNIALPFFANLHQNYKEIILKIHTEIFSIKNKRENISKEWNDTFIEDKSVPNNIYKRAIIIATNVAEASITLVNLKYVIDNGFYKTNIYDPILNKSKLQIRKISESSRIQRKGRVGRTSNGYVYYMYNKGARENILPNYKITQENISDTLINLLNYKLLDDIYIDDKYNYNKLIISNKYNPNKYYKDFPDFKNDNYYIITSKLIDYYKKNIYNNINNYKNIEKYFFEDINEDWIYIFNNGQLLSNLLDNKGVFYLIHPFETKINRNILNEIIYYNNKNINIIPDIDYNYILFESLSQHILININYYKYDDILYYNNNSNYYKSDLYSNINNIKNELNLSINNSITLFFSSAMNCEIEVYEIIIMLEILNYSIKNINGNILSWDKFKKVYNNYKSDIIFIYDIIKELKSYFDLFKFNNKYIHIKCDEIFNLYKNNLDNYNYNLNYELWYKLYNLNITGNISNYKKIIVNSKYFIDLFIINKNDIIKWCDSKYINSNIILSFINTLTKKYITFFL